MSEARENSRAMMRGKLLPLAMVLAACGGDDTPTPTFTREQLLDPQACQDCHPTHYEDWLGSMHAYAADDPVFLAMNRRGQEETDGALGDFCVQCHAPMAVREGATTDGLNLADVDPKLKGVTCYFCHNVDAVEGTHNNPLRLANDLVMRGGITDPVANTAHEGAYSPLLDRREQGSDMCGSCHDIMLDNGVHLERTFSEWKASLFGNGEAGGLACGDCHMGADQGLVAEGIDGVPLRDVHAHRMPGVDIAVTPWPFEDQHREQVEFELEGTLVGQLCTSPPLAESELEVILENAFAGHSFPSGAAHDRRAWVEVRAWDDNDQLIFESGVVQPGVPAVDNITADPDFWLFRDTVFKDDGTEAHMFWEVVDLESNLLVQATSNDPNEIHAQTRIFTVPLADGIPARATMRVLIRPMGLEVLQDLVDSGHLDAEVIDAIPTFEVINNVEWSLDEDGYGCVPKGVF